MSINIVLYVAILTAIFMEISSNSGKTLGILENLKSFRNLLKNTFKMLKK